MIYYKYLDLEWQSSSNKIKDYLLTHNSLLNTNEGSWRLANNWIYDADPEFNQIFKPLDLEVDFVGIFVSHKAESSIHIDNDQKPVRINFPILNCENTVTKYYKFLGKTDLKIQKNGISYHNINENDLEFIDSFVLNNIVAMRVLEPHQVCVNHDTFPRVSCTVQFKQNIEYLLKE